MHRKTLVAALALAAATPAAAQLGWHVGIAGGQAKTSDEAVRNRESTLQFVQSMSTEFDDRDNAWKVFGGMRFNPYLGLEATWVDLGKAQTATRGIGGDPALPFGFIIDRDTRGYGLDAVGTLPFADRFAVFGKAGLYRTTLKASATLEGNAVFSNSPGDRFRTVERKENTRHLGVRFAWSFAGPWTLRVEYERFFDIGKPFEIGGSGTTGEASVDLASVGLSYRF